jgi:mannose-6-phosphate isomerase
MAIAITPFRGFCGFLPPQDISSFLDVVAELGLVIDPEAIATMRYALSCASTSPQAGGDDPMKTSIKALFGSIMTAHPEKVEKAISAIVHRYRTGHVSEKEQPIKELFLDLNSQFPGDVGVLAVYMLNVVSLDVGQAVFLRANEPHAYISGGEMPCAQVLTVQGSLPSQTS